MYVGCMSQFTGGEVFYYPGFKADRDGEKLSNDIRRDITRETGFEAVMRVRTSRGIILKHSHIH
jgi:protein transport protein SEC24